jgi:hypothetical protein
MAFLGTTLPLPCTIYNVYVDTTDEKFIPFHPGISELRVVQCKASGKNVDCDDGYTVVL